MRLDWPVGLVAAWDFNEERAPFRSIAPSGSHELVNGHDADVVTEEGGPFGRSAVFNGKFDFLTIPANDVGELDVGRSGNGVTVLVWVNREKLRPTFVSGMWQEADREGDPQRQYGVFLDLPDHGPDGVCGHVSRLGTATPGYSHSRDASSTKRGPAPHQWRLVGMTYDGEYAVSYLDGIADKWETFTDELGITYPKNPYRFPDGLNLFGKSEFTVGANMIGSKFPRKLTNRGMGLFFGGRIGGLAVWDRPLSQREILRVHSASVGTRPMIHLDFFRREGVGVISPGEFGWQSARGPDARPTTHDLQSGSFLVTRHHQTFLFRSAMEIPANIGTPGITYHDSFAGLSWEEFDRLEFSLNNSISTDTVRVCVRIGGDWYVSDRQFHVKGDGRVGFDWQQAERHVLKLGNQIERWAALRFVTGECLELGSTVQGALPDGEVTAIGFFNEGLASGDSAIRIKDIEIYAQTSPLR